MKHIVKKLKSKAGESLIESLCAILIFTMASIIMYSMVTTAADINMTAKEADEANQQYMLIAEQASGTGTSGNIKIDVIKTEGSGQTIKKSINVGVSIFGSTDTLYSYYKIS